LADRVDLVLDGGAALLGLESTVIGFEDGKAILLRPGALPRARIEAAIGTLGAPFQSGIRSPGQMKRHYAPRTKLRPDAREVSGDEALLAFGAQPLPGARITRNLSPAGDLDEAAANFFVMLRELDTAHCAAIAVMPIPGHGLGEAINDRLRRAAAPSEGRTR